MMALPLLGLTCEPRLVSAASRYYSSAAIAYEDLSVLPPTLRPAPAGGWPHLAAAVGPVATAQREARYPTGGGGGGGGGGGWGAPAGGR
jgi:hypothetical protein